MNIVNGKVGEGTRVRGVVYLNVGETFKVRFGFGVLQRVTTTCTLDFGHMGVFTKKDFLQRVSCVYPGKNNFTRGLYLQRVDTMVGQDGRDTYGAGARRAGQGYLTTSCFQRNGKGGRDSA